MNYGISLNSNINKIIPDYVYFYDITAGEIERIRNILYDNGWITLQYSDNSNRWVNPKNISFIKYETRNSKQGIKYRVIVNLCSSVSLNNDIFARTSDAVYYDFVDIQDFNDAKEYLKDKLDV